MIHPTLYRILRPIHDKLPFIQPYLKGINKVFFLPPPAFSGWEMTTNHALPWVNKFQWEVFRRSSEQVKRLRFSGESGVRLETLDGLQWRHWVVSFAVRYALEFRDKSAMTASFVECGVADGATAFFALRELEGYQTGFRDFEFSFHLYDAWQPMRTEELLDSEPNKAGGYSKLAIDLTKANLEEFRDHVVYHQGYIPESLSVQPPPPETLIYLHIDLNSAKATLSALEFFYQRLATGGVVLFDDYGWESFKDTKETVDRFFADKPGILMPLPTGQAIYFRH